MSRQGSRSTTLGRQEAERAVVDILADKDSLQHLVPFKQYKRSHQGALMKSKQYEKYLVLCHKNTHFHAGWMVCPFVASNHCNAKKGLFAINTKKGGTNRFGRHMAEHEKASESSVTEHEIGAVCRANISRAGAMAVLLDLRPLTFASENEGMAAFAKSIFEAGQSVPYGIRISPKSYLPTKTAINSSLDELIGELQRKFGAKLKDSLLLQGGAVSIDGVTLKAQGRHFYDFTLHHVDIVKGQTVLEVPRFCMRATTVLLTESPEVGNAVNVRAHLTQCLSSLYGIDFHSIQKTFTVVTDGAPVMARIANSSISTRHAQWDHTWMRCHVHVLQNCMKAAFERCSDDNVLRTISADFRSVKRIVEDAKRYGWNKKLPRGFHLIQDVEPRFGTIFLVAERFLKSARKVQNLIVVLNRTAAKNAFESLEKASQPSSGSIASFPCIDAIVDAFGPLYDAVVEFQSSTEPTIHKILPSLQYMKRELSRIELGGSVLRDGEVVSQPSIYSMRFCGIVKDELRQVQIHDLWLLACFLFPFLRDMTFWTNLSEREEFKTRAESLLRIMCGSVYSTSASTSAHGVNFNAAGSGQEMSSLQDSHFERAPKRRKFSLKDQTFNCRSPDSNTDEVTRYKLTPIQQFGLNHDAFMENPTSIFHFWYARRSTYPKLYKTAMRVFATPASSAGSERVFSVVKKLVTPDRSSLSCKHISQIIVGRSLQDYFSN